jgi:hypothetical protein
VSQLSWVQAMPSSQSVFAVQQPAIFECWQV